MARIISKKDTATGNGRSAKKEPGTRRVGKGNSASKPKALGRKRK